MKRLSLFILFWLHVFGAWAQTPEDCSVELWANVQASPPQIKLNWLASTTTTNYSVARKPKNSALWTTLVSSLTGTATQYVDNAISSGTHYEYRLIRNGTNYTGYGYINSGINVPVVEDRGRLILLIDLTDSLNLSFELNRLEDDLEGDGWRVVKRYVDPTWPVTRVKDSVVKIYNADPATTRTLFLFGHIPVPYSGNFGPDGHPNHQGAWPADAYYGELNGIWTDLSVTSTTLSPARTQNVPGDGKFDQSFLPSPMELQVGRVDLWGMTSFTLTETQLLKNYLDKDHAYRKKTLVVSDLAIVDDNFGYMSGEVFAASGYKNFGPFVTPTNVSAASYFTALAGPVIYKWSYGCGPGSYNSAGGIGTTSNFAAANLQGIFTMLFGSYFGDWDNPDNFLRAPLCQGTMLTNAWAGRPQWMFHHMGMGENIGYSTMLTQNNTTTYFPSPYPANYGLFNTVHIALMGDPTLRNNSVAPVANVVATAYGYNCQITWSASNEANVIGYNIYRKKDTASSYTRINPNPLTTLSFTDYCRPSQGIYKYMVRTLKLEDTPSGTYFNMSEGISDTAMNTSNIHAQASFSVVTSSSSVSVVNTSSNSATYFWDFGNGFTSSGFSPSTTYTQNGNYIITLIASNPCLSDTAYQPITIQETGWQEQIQGTPLNMWPNPSTGKVKFEGFQDAIVVTIFNTEGKLVFQKSKITPGEAVDLGNLKKGLYMVQISEKDQRFCKRLLIE